MDLIGLIALLVVAFFAGVFAALAFVTKLYFMQLKSKYRK